MDQETVRLQAENDRLRQRVEELEALVYSFRTAPTLRPVPLDAEAVNPQR